MSHYDYANNINVFEVEAQKFGPTKLTAFLKHMVKRTHQKESAQKDELRDWSKRGTECEHATANLILVVTHFSQSDEVQTAFDLIEKSDETVEQFLERLGAAAIEIAAESLLRSDYKYVSSYDDSEDDEDNED